MVQNHLKEEIARIFFKDFTGLWSCNLYTVLQKNTVELRLAQ